MANLLTDRVMNRVVYITDKSTHVIRSVDSEAARIVTTARTMNARFAVAAHDWHGPRSLPIWSVYDMHKVATPVPGQRGEYALPVPTKQFIAETSEAAEMYALALLAGER